MQRATRLPTAALVIAAAASAAGEAGAIDSPACAALESWAETVDPKDRYTPIPGARTWAPSAFGDPAFAALFGKPALAFDRDDVDALAGLLRDCMNAATAEKRYDAQKSLNAARGMVAGRLTRVIAAAEGVAKTQAAQAEAAEAADQRRAAARAEADDRIDASLRNLANRLLERPDSAALLRDLTLLRAAPPPQPDAVREPFSRNLAREMARYGRTPDEAGFGERFDARIAALRPKIVAAFESRINAAPNSAEGIAALDRLETEITALGDALGEKGRARLAAHLAGRRAAIRGAVVANVRNNISAIPVTLDGLAVLQGWSGPLSRLDVAPAQRHAVLEALDRRAAEVSGALLAEAAAAFRQIPETLAGAEALHKTRARLRPALAAAEPEARAAFETAFSDRRETVLASALPAFRAALDALPETRDGLVRAEAETDRAVALASGAETAGAYRAAARARRAEIAEALAAQGRARREAAIAAGGDPRLVGLRFEDASTGMRLEFRDDALVFLEILGMRAAGEYRVSADDVVIDGPNGQLVLAIGPDALTGMGMRFERRGGP